MPINQWTASFPVSTSADITQFTPALMPVTQITEISQTSEQISLKWSQSPADKK